MKSAIPIFPLDENCLLHRRGASSLKTYRIYLAILVASAVYSLCDLYMNLPLSGVISVLAIAGGIFLIFKLFLDTRNKDSDVLNCSGTVLSLFWAACCVAITAGFSCIFMDLVRQAPSHFNGIIDGISAFYFSVNTFATVGFGEIHPLSSIAKLLVALEIMVAVVVLPVIVGISVAWVIDQRIGLQRQMPTDENKKGKLVSLSRVK